MYKLLIVEDDFIIAKGLQKHFEKYHYDVQYIEDFEHVLDEFLEFQPDLVLLDIHRWLLLVSRNSENLTSPYCFYFFR